MPQLTLYQKDDCHLCDLALEVLAAARVPEFESVFIEDDPEAQARYGTRVPVLREQRSGAELDWPFAADDVHRFLDSAIDRQARPDPGTRLEAD